MMKPLSLETKCEIIILALTDMVGVECVYELQDNHVMFRCPKCRTGYLVTLGGLQRLTLDHIGGYTYNIAHTLVKGDTDLSRYSRFSEDNHA